MSMNVYFIKTAYVKYSIKYTRIFRNKSKYFPET